MATLANLRTDVATLLDDSANDRWSTTDIDSYLNEGQVEFNRLTGVYKASFTITTANGTATYAVTNTVSSASRMPLGPILRIENSSNAQLAQTTEETIERVLQTTGITWPQSGAAATHWARGQRDYNVVRLYPTPNGVATYTALAASYTPTMTSSPQVDSVIPEHFVYALPFYAAWRCLLRNSTAQDLGRAQAFRARFDQIVAEAQAEAGRSLVA